MENFTTKAMFGLSIIGSMEPQNIAFILSGHYDFELKCALYYRRFFKTPENEQELENPDVLEHLERIKNYFRSYIQKIFDAADREDRAEAEKIRRENLKKMSQPHEMGTVAEIAAKHNISKAEVRRMKAAGTLESLATLDAIQ